MQLCLNKSDIPAHLLKYFKPKHVLKQKDDAGIPWRVAFALQADGWYLRSAMPWLKRSAMPESVTDRPTSAVEYFFLLTKNRKYYYDADAIREPIKKESKRRAMRGVSSRNKYVADHYLPPGVHANTISQPRENRGYEMMEELIAAGKTPLNPNGRNRRNTDWFMDSIRGILEGQSGTMLHNENGLPIAIFCNPQPYKKAHFATFSPRLIAPMILAGTSPMACEVCGAPWERVVEKGAPIDDWKKACGADSNGEYEGRAQKDYEKARAENASEVKKRILAGMLERKTTGWQPTCTCQNSGRGRCIVLDPFAGSGTTLYVAEQYGRDSVGIELSDEYCNLIYKRMDNMQQTIFGLEVQ